MWNGLLHCTDMAEHHIELRVLDIHPINSAMYCAVLKAREFERAESDKMLRMNVRETAHSKWAPLILFSPKEGPVDMILHRLQKTERHDCQVHLSVHANRGTFGILRQNGHILIVRCPFVVIANQN